MKRFTTAFALAMLGTITAWAVPGKPTLQAPVAGPCAERRPTFAWTAAPNATQYLLRITRANGTTYLEKATRLTTYTPKTDIPEGFYDVRVAGYDGTVYGKWSTVVRFRRVFAPALASLNGLAEDGGNIDLVAGPGIAISPDPTNLSLLISATGTASVEIVDLSITTLKLDDGAVTGPKLADNSVTSNKIVNGSIYNTDIAAAAAISDTKLATISTAGKVANSATTATGANTAGAIVARDGSGNFSANRITAALFSGSGDSLTSLDASQLASGTVPEARLPAALARTNQVWLLGGNAGTAGANSLGTTDSQPLEIKVNRLRAIRLEDNGDSGDAASVSDGSPNILMGSPGNFAATNAVGAVIAGGGSSNYNGFVEYNWVKSDYAAIGGGLGNQIAEAARLSVIDGGFENRISSNSYCSTLGGGSGNSILVDSHDSTIGGGYHNQIQTNAAFNTISGGNGNVIQSSALYAAIGGGYENQIQSNSMDSAIGGGSRNTIQGNYAAIPGGQYNSATNYAFAAGRRAKAIHAGAFVWADSNDADLFSAANNSVTLRAGGGYRLFTTSATNAGVSLGNNATAWSVISDRNQKKGFAPVDGREVLETLAGVPITRWHYLWEGDEETLHMGPMAQDFIPAFYPGRDDTRITTQEADGVALAAIQGLNRKLEEEAAALRAETAELRTENEALKARLDRLEQRLGQAGRATSK